MKKGEALMPLMLLLMAGVSLGADPLAYKQDYPVTIHNRCGNVEFEIKFLKPKITLNDAKLLKEFTIIDLLDEPNPMKV